MTLYTATYNSPLGPIVIESDGEALTGLRFGDSGIGKSLHLMPTHTTSSLPIFDEAIRWLDDYFAGKRPCNVPRLNPQGTAFQKRVWTALLTIPYGKTVNYGELARMVGCKSAQAVGQAVGANPIALIIPCHRVIAAHGQLGGYEYGTEIKKKLLELEGNPTKTSVMRTRCERE